MTILLERVLFEIFLLTAKDTLCAQLRIVDVGVFDLSLWNQVGRVLLLADLLGAVSLLRLLVRRRSLHNIIRNERIVGVAISNQTLR